MDFCERGDWEGNGGRGRETYLGPGSIVVFSQTIKLTIRIFLMLPCMYILF